MAFPVLPPKYYLAHFFEFLSFLESFYLPLMETQHQNWIRDFRALSEDSQCVFVRMLNRKGFLFEKDNFKKYSEIENLYSAFEELQLQKFVRSFTKEDKKELTEYLTKAELKKWLSQSGIETKSSLSRESLVQLAQENLDVLDLEDLNTSGFVVQSRTEEMDYLLFLYFGKIQKSLNLYTLRDLGIRKSGTLKTEFKPRFKNLGEAQAEFFFAQQTDRFGEITSVEEIRKLFEVVKNFKNLRYSTQNLKDELLFRMACSLDDEEGGLALELFLESQHPEAREKAIRYLYKVHNHEACQFLLEEILEKPRTDIELMFAEDFLARKFQKKKQGYLTEVLRKAQEIELSDFFLKKPEQGVCEYFRAQGFTAHFTENNLWNGFFGVLFWEELFDAEDAAIHNPFERSPSDLVGPEFYEKNRATIEKKLSLLKDEKSIEKVLLKSIAQNYGRLNDIFLWYPSLSERLLHFARTSTQKNVAHVLRTMAQGFDLHHSGFPDVMIEKEGLVKFIEVKAEGDALRASQLSKIRLLQEAGFEVEVLRVYWKTDPNQVYVVLDVETTGGSAGFHRVTEVGAVKIQNGQVIDEFQTLINPGRPIPAFISQITGITNEMVANAPAFSEIAEKLLKFMEGAIFVAHNVKFDYSFIQREFARAEIEFVRPHLCTCAGMRKAYPGIPSYSLKNLTEHFEISMERHHRALSDARAAGELLLLMNKKRKSELAY